MSWARRDVIGWGRATRCEAELARPEKFAALQALGGEGPAIGMRRSYGDAALNSGGRLIDMTRLDRLLGFDPDSGVLEVEAGALIGEILRVMAPQGWGLAVMPGTGFATVGGAIAFDVHGKNHPQMGSFGQHLASLTVLQGRDERTLLPADPLFAATVGGLGQTGVIISARIKLQKLSAPLLRVSRRRVPDLTAQFEALSDSTASHAVSWIDASAAKTALGRGILQEADPAEGPPIRPRRPLGLRFDAPGFLLSAPVVRAFNALHWQSVPQGGGAGLCSLAEFHFPLDRIGAWNRLYGRRGFHQFQCVVPLTETEALRRMLGRVVASGMASPLAVLKRLGPGRAGLISFPMAGWTLALDLPARPMAAELICWLNQQAAEAGGRVYLAKDSLLTPQLARVMYPRLAEWQALVEAADPSRAYLTDLVRRLRLREG